MKSHLEEIAQALFEEAGDALFLLEPKSGQILDANPMALKLSGFPIEDLRRKRATDLFRSEAQGGLERMQHAAKRTGTFHSQEGYLLRHQHDGVWIPVNLTITRLHLESGTLGLITARDVRERHEAEDRLKQAETELRRVLASVADCVWSADIDGAGKWVYRYYSPVVEKITGRPPEYYLLGLKRWLGTIHPEDRQRVEDTFFRLKKFPPAQEKEYRVVRPDGAVRWVRDSVRVTRGSDGVSLKLDGVLTDVTQRKRMEKALRRSEERFRALVEMSSDAIALLDVKGTIVYASSSTTRILGYDLDDFLDRSSFDLVHPDDLSRAREVFASCLDSPGKEVKAQYRFRHRDGSWRDVECSANNRLRDPAVRAVVVNYHDVTEHNRAEQALRRSEEQYRELVENANDIIYTHDLEGNVTSINQVSERMTGYTRAEALRLNLANVVAPEKLEVARQMIRRKLAGEATPAYELEILAKDGRRIPIEVNSRLIYRDGKPVGVQGIYRDITDRKRAEEAIRASEAKYRTLIENLEQGVFLKDRDLRYVAANKVFCQSLDRSEADIVGKTDDALYPGPVAERYRAADRGVLDEGKRVDAEEQHTVAGELRTFRTLRTPVKDGLGRTGGVLGIFWDVTEQRALEAQLRQAQKMEAVGQLAGGVAHDFNNLLTAVLGNIALLMESPVVQEPDREALLATEAAAARAAELTKQLLGFSRQTMLRPQATDLNHTVREIVRILRRTIDPRIVLEVKDAPDLWPVQADPTQMNQVLMNLCLNARDAMPEGGGLFLETDNVTLDEEYARLHLEARPGEFVRLRVRDTGQGIPADILPRIFEPFFTTKEPGKGTGLGLAMVFGILKQHRGWVECQSEAGRGTCFDIYVPRSRQAVAALAPRPIAGMPRGRETVLLVDDEAIVRNLGRTILQRQGYQVLLAEDGQEAVEIFERDKDRIDLVILDLTMPRLSGQDAFRQMYQIDPGVRVLFSSGYSAEEAAEGSGDKILGFVNKPYRPQDLAQAVRTALDQARRPQPAVAQR
ncbi:MAG TPA: PAS domain S-box protein [Gemmataceae bacterium]|jgi:PAS domain S-box-containing protein|nr:PAS domain S-box protein [Gemmataceae bacterium]